MSWKEKEEYYFEDYWNKTKDLLGKIQ